MLMVTHSTVAKILNNFYCLFQKRIAYIQVNEPSVLMLCINLIMQEVSAFFKVLTEWPQSLKGEVAYAISRSNNFSSDLIIKLS